MIVCGKCKTPMTSASSAQAIYKTRKSHIKSTVCALCYANAADWQKRSKSGELK